MADTTTTKQVPVLRISMPGPGESTSYQLTTDTLVKFTFDLSEAEFIGNGNNLEIYVEGGGKIILLDYLILAEMKNLPSFEMIDGELVPGGVYLFAFEGEDQPTEEALETAADAGTSGSGAGAYSDDPGSLFAGLDALGGQGDAYDSHSIEALEPIPELILDEPTPPVAIDDVNIIIEDEWNRGEGDNGNGGHGQLDFVEGNLLLNDYDDDNIDYPETGGSQTELSVNAIDFVGEDFTGNNPDAVVVTDAGVQVNGLYGTLTVFADGSYSYELDQNLADPLRENQEVEEIFNYTAIDPDGNVSNVATLTITVIGRNDAPDAFDDEPVDDVIEQGSVVAGVAVVSGNVLHNDSDVDNIGYEDLDPAYADLVPVDPDDVIELGVTSIYSFDTYQYDDTPDNGVMTVDGQYGTLTINTDGSYEYVLDQNKADPLNTEDDLIETFSYSMWDGDKYDYAMLNIPVHGSNDAPVATVDTGEFTEAVDSAAAAIVAGNVLSNDTDVDNIDLGDVGTSELTVSDIDYTGGGTPPARTSTAYVADHIVEGEFGTLYLNDDGTYHYVEDKSATDPLNTDDSPVTDVFTYEVSDNQSGSALTDTATLTITISGANDSPIATVDTNSFTEAVDAAAAADVSGNVLSNDTDIDNVDLGDVGTSELTVSDIDYTGGGTPPSRTSTEYVADHVIEGVWGTLYLNEDGSYHYVEDKDATDPLNIDDAAVTDVFTYEVTDNQPGSALTDTATLTITIDPANDTPVAVHDGSHDIFIETTVVTVIDDWSEITGSVYYGPGYTVTAEAFDSLGDPVSDVAFTTWGNDQHLGIYTDGSSDDRKVDDKGATEQITFEFDDPQSSFSIEFVAHGANHVNAYVYPVGGGSPTLFTNVGNAVYITPGFEFDTIVFVPDGAFGMESLTTVTGGESSISGVADGNVLANDHDIDNVDFDAAVAAGDMSLLELSVTDIDSTNSPGNTPSPGTDVDGDYYTIEGEFGSLKIYDTGEWAYTPFEEVNDEGGWQNLEASSTDVFEYTVSDGSGGTDTAFIEVSLNVNTGNVLGGSGTVLGSASDDVIFPVDGDDVHSDGGSDLIVIDPENLGSGATSIDILDFSDSDSLALGNLEGATVAITSNTNDVNLVFTDIDGSDDIVVNLMGVTPVNDAVNQVVEITTSEDLNSLIQSIIDSGNDAII